jgi:hypothetical protein
MIAHTDEIYSRPKRTWFATEKEKKALAKVAKGSDVVVPSFHSLYLCCWCFVFIVPPILGIQ